MRNVALLGSYLAVHGAQKLVRPWPFGRDRLAPGIDPRRTNLAAVPGRGFG
jgi:hypothetical protein